MRGFCILLLVSGSLWVQPAVAEPKDTTATIAAWNIFGLRTLNASRIDTIADGIVALDAELVVLSEVKPDDVMDALVSKLGERGAEYRHAIKEQSADLNLAILYKEGVEVTDVDFIPQSNIGNADLRKALVARAKIGEFDFAVVGLHLKSGRYNDNRETRDRQCRKITAWVKEAMDGTEKDVLILGDYNMVPDRDTSNFEGLERDYDLRYISSEVSASRFTHIRDDGSGGNFLDGFAISQDHTGEYVETSTQVVELHKVLGLSLRDYRNRVTDHLPIVARFRINKDDDQ